MDGAAHAVASTRVSWSSCPAELRDAVDQFFGGRVIDAVTMSGGYSRDMACRLRFEDGSRVFVKGCGPGSGEASFALHRAEARIAEGLPSEVPAPRLLALFEVAGWVVLAFEHVTGAPPGQPWEPDELTNVLATVTVLRDALNPSPIDAPSVGERLGDAFRGWRRLRNERDAGADIGYLGTWALRHLDDLAEVESRWAAAAAGPVLAHADLRADNLLISNGRVVVVDWPWACTAVGWFDLLGLLPSVHLADGPTPESIWNSHPVTRGADDDAVTTVLAAKTGFFLRQAHQPAPNGVPTLRAFQQAQGEVALRWLRARTQW